MSRPYLKVCCMGSVEEARLAISCGASAVGLVAEMPSGPGPISDALIAEIARTVPPPVATFLLSSRSRASDLADHVQATGVQVLQIVRHIDPAEYPELRRLLPRTRLVQVVHVEDEASLALARDYGRLADALLLDSGRPKAAVVELGGTGRVHDWALSRRIRDSVAVPIFLAGGITPANVREAIDSVAPHGIDLCSGVRTNGRLNEAKLAALTAAMWGR